MKSKDAVEHWEDLKDLSIHQIIQDNIQETRIANGLLKWIMDIWLKLLLMISILKHQPIAAKMV